jgi:hypothetical protein
VWKTWSDGESTGIPGKAQQISGKASERASQTSAIGEIRDGVRGLAVQSVGLTPHAECSACPGDYEDPERSVPSQEFPDEEYDGEYEPRDFAGDGAGDDSA